MDDPAVWLTLVPVVMMALLAIGSVLTDTAQRWQEAERERRRQQNPPAWMLADTVVLPAVAPAAHVAEPADPVELSLDDLRRHCAGVTVDRVIWTREGGFRDAGPPIPCQAGTEPPENGADGQRLGGAAPLPER